MDARDADAKPQVFSSTDLLGTVYADLRRMARGMVNSEAPQTLTATALVHEAWLRVSRDGTPRWENRRHFFGAAAQAMRRVLMNRARDKHRVKRGGGQEHIPLEDMEIEAPAPEAELLAVDEALDRLAHEQPLIAEIVSLRYFTGLKWPEIAEITGLSERDLNRHWAFARAWLKTEIEGH
jgi:RNA polymerase sigma factor (TIGR02999 family)